MDGFLLPQFSVSQNDENVVVEIECPEAPREGAPSVATEGCIFGFRFDPYYLPLVLPHPIFGAETKLVETGRCCTVLRKQQFGQLFEDLDQLKPCLLPDNQLKQAEADAHAGRGFFQTNATAESGSTASHASRASSSSDQVAAQLLLQQAMSNRGLVSVDDDDGETKLKVELGANSAVASRYGFGLHNAHHDSLIPVGAVDSHSLLEVRDPGSVPPQERLRQAIAYEDEHWDEGVYMENFLDQEGEIAHLLRFSPQIPSGSISTQASSTEPLAADTEILCVLVQLLFAFCYDNRTNEGEPTVESGWNIAKLCRCLAASVNNCSDAPFKTSLTTTLVGCIRRSLTVPLYRHWQLAIRCLASDTVRCLFAGRLHVADCLSDIQRRLELNQDTVQVELARVWVIPLLNALPADAVLQGAAQTIKELIDGSELTKDSVGGDAWDLEVLEVAAQQALNDGEGGFV